MASQKAKVPTQVIAPGRPLTEKNDVVAAFLAFLERDMRTHPERMGGLSKRSIARAVRLTKGVKVAEQESVPNRVSF